MRVEEIEIIDDIIINDLCKVVGNIFFNGPSRSGKTQALKTFIFILSRIIDMSKRPNLVISDPKGELSRDCTEMLTAQGYDVKIINYRLNEEGVMLDTASYNPLKYIYDSYKKQFDKIKPFLNMEKIKTAEYPIVEYWNQIKSKVDLISTQFNQNEVIQEITTFGMIFFPDENNNPNLYFLQNARKLLHSLCYFLLENAILADDYRLFNFNSLFIYMQSYDFLCQQEFVIEENGFEKTVKGSLYSLLCDQLPPTHFSRINIPRIKETKQYDTFLTEVAIKLDPFTTGARIMSATNNIDLTDFVYSDRPVALFIIIPDYQDNYNFLVTTLVEQIFEICSKHTEYTIDQKLKRPLLMLIEEMANIPAIPNFANKTSICLSRNIYFLIILQSYNQLISLYDREQANTIMANMHHKIILSANTNDEAEWLACEIGKTTKQRKNINIDDDNSKVDIDFSEEYNYLMTPEEIRKLQFGECVHVIKGMNPIKGNFIPAYKYLHHLYKPITVKEFFDKNDHLRIHTHITDDDLLFENFLNPFGGEV